MNREEKTVQGIVRKLSEPQNRDLLSKVMGHIGENDSFMFTFEQHDKVDFDTFCTLNHQLDEFVKAVRQAMGEEFDENFRSMSDRYDEYLAKESDAKLSKEQTSASTPFSICSMTAGRVRTLVISCAAFKPTCSKSAATKGVI